MFVYVLLLIQGVTASAALGVGRRVSNGIGNVTAVVSGNPAPPEFPVKNLKKETHTIRCTVAIRSGRQRLQPVILTCNVFVEPLQSPSARMKRNASKRSVVAVGTSRRSSCCRWVYSSIEDSAVAR